MINSKIVVYFFNKVANFEGRKRGEMKKSDLITKMNGGTRGKSSADAHR